MDTIINAAQALEAAEEHLKQVTIEAAMKPGANIAAIARTARVNRVTIYRWIKTNTESMNP